MLRKWAVIVYFLNDYSDPWCDNWHISMVNNYSSWMKMGQSRYPPCGHSSQGGMYRGPLSNCARVRGSIPVAYGGTSAVGVGDGERIALTRKSRGRGKWLVI